MLKRLVQLLIAVILIYAGWHAGVAYFHYYQFTDAIGELALFAGTSTEDQLKERVVQLAQQYDVPVDASLITVHTSADATQISAPYTEKVNLLPNYVYEWKLEPKASVVHVH
ncbi:MAG: hypothetical protein ACM36C_00450 [Acidobacteriota bacterium]